MDGPEVGGGGEGDGETGGFGGDVRIVALAMGEGVQLEEGDGVS